MQSEQEVPTAASAPARDPAAVRIDVAGLTDVGRKRSANEDAFVIATLQRSIVVNDASPGARGWFSGEAAGTLLVVADGMGGQGGGDTASQVAVTTVVNHLLNCMPWVTAAMAAPDTHSKSLPGVRAELSNALVAGDETVKAAGARTGTPRMGTTLTMALILWPVLYVAHVGDSRCYLLRSGQLRQLTTDHTLAQKFAEMSARDVEPESRLHHILWNSLGASEELPQPEIIKLELELGDVLLVCSDGLSKHVTDDDIAATLLSEEPPNTQCAKLVARANAAGGSDNVTALVARAAIS